MKCDRCGVELVSPWLKCRKEGCKAVFCTLCAAPSFDICKFHRAEQALTEDRPV